MCYSNHVGYASWNQTSENTTNSSIDFTLVK